jgi:hypothetical protein
MIKIIILKNDKVFKTFTAAPSEVQSVFNKALDLAGSLWNGVDEFSVAIE